ncbi:MAG: tetratricopeptide repeat protein, partial [Vicinamibacteraceae bacterium]|nr:tetratricopeptide repeat protein [Vicinamibacteraceae bacterium]
MLLGAACGGDRQQAKQAHLANGNAFFEKGDYQKAVLEYRNAVRIDERFGEARYQLARAYEKLQDPAAAFRELTRAADLLPDRTDVQLHAARYLLLAERFDDARTTARKVLAKDVANTEALIILGNASARLKDFDTATRELETAVARAPGDTTLQAALGAVRRVQGNLPDAEAAFRNAVTSNPKSVEARLALANYYWSVGDLAQAEQALTAALALDPEGSAANRSMALLYFATDRPADGEARLLRVIEREPQDPGPHLALGDYYVRTAQYDKARRMVETALALDLDARSRSTVVARSAWIEHAAGNRDVAYKKLNDALTATPKDTEVRAMLARLLLADHRWEEAVTHAKQVVQAEPYRYESHYVHGTASLELQRWDEAAGALRQAAEQAPRTPGPKLQLARIMLVRGDVKGAQQLAREAVDLDPRQPLARAVLVRTYLAARDAAGAEAALGPLATVASESAETQYLVGAVAMLQGRRGEARTAFEKALRLDPGSQDALAGLVEADLAMGRAADADAMLGERLKQRPTDGRLLVLAARTALAQKNPTVAEVHLKKAIESSSTSFTAYEMLARLYWSQGRLEEARGSFEKLAQAQPGQIGPPTMVGIIQQLQGKPKDAQLTYERLLAARPDAPIAANNLAMLLVDHGGNLDVALNYAQVAKKALPEDANVSDTLGMVYFKKGLHSQAVSLFEEATE